jgi:glutathione synthase/RimK-type ligase-like ATP-grasp enzyme
MKDIFVLPYHRASKSAAALAEKLNCKRIRVENSNYKPTKEKLVVNWGSATQQALNFSERGAFLNNPVSVNTCANKLSFFQSVPKEVTPEWTTSVGEASLWEADGSLVVGRFSLRGNSGEGIFFSDSENQDDRNMYSACKLYTKYIPKMKEFRVHVFQGKVVDIQQKKLRKTDDRGVEVDPKLVNWRVRNHQNGFVFARQEVEVPECVPSAALQAFEPLKLDFGAFDVIWNKAQNRAWVLECNTAPGLEGETLTKYAEAIRNV